MTPDDIKRDKNTLYATSNPWAAVLTREQEDAAKARVAAHAVNRLPAYIAEAEETQRRIAAIETTAADAERAARRHAEMSEAAGAEREAARASALRWALKMMRGEP